MNAAGVEDFARWKSFLYYGPRAVDWKFYFIPINTEYEWAGEFWNWIENPELFSIPGTFLYSETEEEDWYREGQHEREVRFRATRKERWLERHSNTSKVSEVE